MSTRVIGLDLGSSSIKASQVLHHDDGTYFVEHQATRQLPRGTIIDGHIEADKKALVINALVEMMSAESKFTTKDAIFGLNSSSSIFMEEVLVPVMDADDLEAALPNVLAAQDEKYAAGKNEIAFAVVGPVGTERGPRLRVLVFRALADYVKEMAELVEAAGLNVVGSDFHALAALRVIDTAPRPDRQADALIDIGANVTSVLIHHNGVPKMLALDPEMAGGVATERVADALGLDYDDDLAEFHKINNSDSLGLVPQARSRYSEAFVERVHKTLKQFVDSSDDIDSIAAITLVGGGALLAGLSDYLRSTFGDVPRTYASIGNHVTGGDPLGTNGVRRQEPGSGGDYLVSIGLGTGVRA